MQPPERIESPGLADYLEVMSKAVFQAGIRWATIDDKWPAFKKVFRDFDPKTVAAFTTKDVARLSQDESILRSPKKIEATVKNAQMILELDKKHKGFRNYLRSFDDYQSLSRDLKKRFNFMGELNAYYFLFRVNEPVPPFEEWVETIPGDHPRMKEMIEHARMQDKARKQQRQGR
jgi:3-methyladenine DNA glycosylase Tag